jgi:hypothetical protein
MDNIALSPEELNATFAVIREMLRHAPPLAPVLYLAAAILARFAHKHIYLIYVMFFAATLIGVVPHFGGTDRPTSPAARGLSSTHPAGQCRAARPQYHNCVVNPRWQPSPSQSRPSPVRGPGKPLPTLHRATPQGPQLICRDPATPGGRHRGSRATTVRLLPTH